MSASEVQRIARIMSCFGIWKIKLTGGEPMLRPDIVQIISGLHELFLKEVSMTTNGTRVALLASQLKDAGLDRVNISLHSLRRERFRFITGLDALDEVLNACEASVENGLIPVKLNVTLMKGVNEDELPDLVEYASHLSNSGDVIVQLIELVSTDQTFFSKYHVDMSPLEAELRERAIAILKRSLHNRCQYTMPNGVIVEVVRPMHNSEFCVGDTRIRITPDGKFKPCLLRNDNLVDFLKAMRSGARDEDIAELFKKAVSLREPYFKPQVAKRDRSNFCTIPGV
jgi:cyclic pyranopterin phosphate synthase